MCSGLECNPVFLAMDGDKATKATVNFCTAESINKKWVLPDGWYFVTGRGVHCPRCAERFLKRAA